jgi:hypothetical protein
MATTTETATVVITDNRPKVFSHVKYPVLTGLGFSLLLCKRTHLPTADLFPFPTTLGFSRFFPVLDSWFLVLGSVLLWRVYECTRYDGSTRSFLSFLAFWVNTNDDSGSPLTSPTLSLDIPNSITNVQIKRDSVDRCSPFLGVGSLFPIDNNIRGSVDRCSLLGMDLIIDIHLHLLLPPHL